MAHPSIAGLRRDKVYEFRCLDCGNICWTTLQIGCKKCKSKSLEDFEPYDHVLKSGRSAPIQSFSYLLADSNRPGTPHQHIEDLQRIFKQENTPIRESHIDELLPRLEQVASYFAQSRLSGPGAMAKFASLWETSQKAVQKEKDDLEILAFNLTAELFGNIKNEKPTKQVSYEVDKTFFATWRLGQFENVISARVLNSVPKQDHAGIKTYLQGPPEEHPYVPAVRRLPRGGIVFQQYDYVRGFEAEKIEKKTFHVNMSAASWEFLSNLGRLLPLAYVLLSSHLPNAIEVGAAAAVVRTILKSITRLRDIEGEQCVVSGVLSAKAEMGHDPTTAEISDELRKRACLGKPCKFAQSAYDCSVTKEDVEAILKFLEAKKVVEKTSAASWNVI